MPNEALDALDRRIVAALQADGRLSNVDLAEQVGLSPSPCLRRVNRLERPPATSKAIAPCSAASASASASASSSA